MNRNEIKQNIVDKTQDSRGWGHVCNTIQDVVFDEFNEKELQEYCEKAQKDAEECEGSDFVTFNGQYFDWKEFNRRCDDIVKAFLDYFDNNQLNKIAKHL